MQKINVKALWVFLLKEVVQSIADFIGRYGLLVAVVLIIVASLGDTYVATITTIKQIALVECLAIAMSSFAALVFTQIKFTSKGDTHALSRIFLGVHICIGLSVLGIYFLQWSTPGG